MTSVYVHCAHMPAIQSLTCIRRPKHAKQSTCVCRMCVSHVRTCPWEYMKSKTCSKAWPMQRGCSSLRSTILTSASCILICITHHESMHHRPVPFTLASVNTCMYMSECVCVCIISVCPARLPNEECVPLLSNLRTSNIIQTDLKSLQQCVD
jgi:hypothetical protein